MFDIIHGIQYQIVFKDKIDYYDIIPELEMKFRSRFYLYGRAIRVIRALDTADRFIQTTLYKEWLLNKEEREIQYGEHLEKFIETLGRRFDYAKDHDLYIKHCDETKRNLKERFYSIADLPIELTSQEKELVFNVTKYIFEKYNECILDAYWVIVEDMQ